MEKFGLCLLGIGSFVFFGSFVLLPRFGDMRSRFSGTVLRRMTDRDATNKVLSGQAGFQDGTWILLWLLAVLASLVFCGLGMLLLG